MPNIKELEEEMVEGHWFNMRSDGDFNAGQEFVWGGLTLRTIDKTRDHDGLVPNHWPWRFMYTFEILATQETPGVGRGTI